MNINDGHEEVITLQGIWSLALKVALALSVPTLFTLLSLGTWTIVKIFEHDTRLALVEREVSRSTAKGSVSQTQSVITSDAAALARKQELTDPARGYLTTAQIADKFNMTERTVVDWIAKDRFQPAPIKDGREYRFAANSRILPQTADDCGNEDEAAAPH